MVARIILNALSTKQPKRQYSIGLMAKAASFLEALPQSVADWNKKCDLNLEKDLSGDFISSQAPTFPTTSPSNHHLSQTYTSTRPCRREFGAKVMQAFLFIAIRGRRITQNDLTGFHSNRSKPDLFCSQLHADLIKKILNHFRQFAKAVTEFICQGIDLGFIAKSAMRRYKRKRKSWSAI